MAIFRHLTEVTISAIFTKMDNLYFLTFMQHSDNKDRTLKPMKNPFDDCDEVELHRIMI